MILKRLLFGLVLQTSHIFFMAIGMHVLQNV